MHFTFSEAHLRRLLAINSFPLPADGLVFFGLRGCLPVDDDRHDFAAAHPLYLADYDHIHPRCTLGQWLPKDRTIALFPGSTVPCLRYVKRSVDRGGRGANMMMTGMYLDYRKGWHRAGKPTGHEAFRQTAGRPIRRTADDFDYDNDDRVEFTNPYDNLHAGWCMGVEATSFASAGCQVLVGYPKCSRRGNKGDAGPWKHFKANAYGLAQNSFSYVLLNGRDALKVSGKDGAPQTARLRYGSRGSLVTELQEALKGKGHYEGKVDDDFGRRTIRAVLDFQTEVFGDNEDDGIVGPLSAAALDLNWPKI